MGRDFTPIKTKKESGFLSGEKGEDLDVVGSGEEEIACGVFEFPAGRKERLGVSLKTFESATDVDKAGVFELGEGLEEGWVESFAGRIDEDCVVRREGGFFSVDARVGKRGGIEAGEALLEREGCVRVVFDEVDLFCFVAKGKSDGADSGIEFEKGGLGGDPRGDALDHLFEKGKMGLGKCGGMEGDWGAAERLPKERFTVESFPAFA